VDINQKPYEEFSTQILQSRLISSIRPKFYAQHSQPNISTPTILRGRYIPPRFSSYRPSIPHFRNRRTRRLQCSCFLL